MTAFQHCINPDCGHSFDLLEVHHRCPDCGALLDVEYEWDKLPVPKSLAHFEQYWGQRRIPQRHSGVWRFHELLPFAKLEECVTIGEGQTILQKADYVAPYAGLVPGSLYLQYEGMNPSGSFKDNGMAAGTTHGKLVGAKHTACASTGNTSASLAIYCGVTRMMNAVIFIGSGKIAYGKLSQALDYGARTIQIEGDFDDAMARVQEASKKNVFTQINQLYQLASAGIDALHMSTGLAKVPTLVGLAGTLKNFDPDKIYSQTVPIKPDPADPNRVVWTEEAAAIWKKLKDGKRLTEEDSSNSSGSSDSGSSDSSDSASASPQPAPSETSAVPQKKSTLNAQTGLLEYEDGTLQDPKTGGYVDPDTGTISDPTTGFAIGLADKYLDLVICKTS